MKVKDCVLIEAFKCNENERVIEVAKKLREITIRHIFVVNDKDWPVGIISIVDINNRVVAEGRDAHTLNAREIMSKPIRVVDVDEDIDGVYRNMVEKGHVMNAVVKEGKMIGIITLHQILKNLKMNEKNG